MKKILVMGRGIFGVNVSSPTGPGTISGLIRPGWIMITGSDSATASGIPIPGNGK